MSKTFYTKCSIFLITAFLIIFINYCSSAPVNVAENAYTQFISELNRNKCSVPTQVQLPFDTNKTNDFEYFTSYLEICQNTESTKRNKEAVVLCKEIFDNVRNISCSKKIALPDMNVKLSENVCKDIEALKDSVPENDKSLLKRLTDKFLCDIMCDSEFEKACQVLLWSFEVQKSIASIVNSQEPEQPNVPEDGVDNNYNFKQDNAVEEGNSLQIGVNLENGKQNLEEAKDVNGVIGYDSTIENSLPIKENTEQMPNEMANPSNKETQENPLPANKAILENKSVSKAESQDITDASAGSLKASSTFSQHKAETTNLNTEVKPLDKITKGDSTVQNMNEQLQGSIVNQPDVKLEKTDSELPRDSNDDVATNEQTQAIGVDILNGKQVHDEKDNITPKEHLQDNSNIPANSNIPVDGEDGPNSEMDPIPKETDQSSNVLNSNLLPHESGNEKSPNDAVASEQNPSNLVDTHPQNKLQSSTSNEDKLVEKTLAPVAGSQSTKDTTQHQTIKETNPDKTSITGVDIKADRPQTNSDLRNVATQGETKPNEITHDLVTKEGNGKILTDQKEPSVVQKTEEFDNTIPDTTGPSIPANQRLPEKTQNPKTAVVNSADVSVVPSSLTTSTKTTVALEKMEGGSELLPPVDEEPGHYGDLENTEDDYSRRDYDGFYESSKNKESNPDIPSPIAVARDVIPNPNDKPIEFPSRNAFGQNSNDIIGFPEEDGHFFFYFLSIVLILMGGYLLFHNKQKIIALIVEGHHERNRRSPRVGYKKLETK